MSAIPLQISLAPLSPREIDLVLLELARQHLPVLRTMRQPHPRGCLLLVELEVALHEETPRWFAERMVAHLWHALGRFVRISCWFEDASETVDGVWLDFEETDYRTLLPAFRLSRRF
ncbi:hypothetical protein IGB42_03617 [Andreprevotia sp. IGB-42]|uniref:hypothetical protein n=1 Tax=Andreprevotia sp. IGB-42 TaxID=2497473 RepID=UPI00135A0776|nr:hypothetical protein [Andreprevotia sp. IGB-42]KAF0811807.1 hypothetical protein IGB42_03617 [Andreprevotia sp. IGB-42]